MPHAMRWAGGCWAKSFIAYSIVAGGGFSVFYALVEQFPPFMAGPGKHPLAAALAGACFVGVGVGLAVRRRRTRRG